MRRFLSLAVLMGGIAILTGGINAQQPEPKKGAKGNQKGGFGDFKMLQPIFSALGSSPASLLVNKSVQEEIKLTEEQIKTLTEKTKERMGGNMQERMGKMMEKAKELEGVAEDKIDEKVREVFKEEIEAPMQEAEKILKPEQIKRLKQVHFQSMGTRIFTDYTYAKTLKITEEQKTKAKEINAELSKDLQELGIGRRPGGNPGGGRPMQPSKETMEKVKKLRDEAKEKAMELLTADQKSMVKEMSGEPFELKQEPGRFPGGGFPGGGRPTPKKDD